MAPLINWLDQSQLSARQCRFVTTVQEALRHDCHDQYPDLIIVLQSWSDQYSRQDVSELMTFAPLARIVVCYGAWCESDGRNHAIWPQSVRVPLWAAKSRIEREWALIGHAGDVSAIPLSASREEVFAADHPAITIELERFDFMVDSPDSTYAQSVAEIMIAAGHRNAKTLPNVVLFDVDPWGAMRIAALQIVREQFPTAVVVGLSSWASPSLEAELSELGIRRLLQKLGFTGLEL